MKLKAIQFILLVSGLFLSSCLSSCSWGKEVPTATHSNKGPQGVLPISPQAQDCKWQFTAEMTPLQVAQTAYRMQQECQLSEQEILQLAKLTTADD
ncbi:hypothetical protein [Pseudobdellovibrio exovorus]|uniref:Uncharacterized protein n=1 Tax=Pseudobdellovibrio exovorus JSS TaxID=1184267 RepID=M4VA11_9BACT|nr:hypothetical protein [Pseudobdellovibrio exovorus]AGH96242.1 hypothetical protein A11Q_2026 [Pseudobdellovibrio exovorus JSS]